MGSPTGNEADLKKLVLDLTGDDWAKLEPLHPRLIKLWGKGLRLQAKSIKFSPELAPMVRIKINRLPPRFVTNLVEPIWVHLQREVAEESREGANLHLGPRILAIADLPSDLFSDAAAAIRDLDALRRAAADASDDEVMDADAAIKPTEVVQSERDAEQGPVGVEDLEESDGQARRAVGDSDPEFMRSALGELRALQPLLIEKLDSAVQAVSNGTAVPDVFIESIVAWNGVFDGLPDSVEAPASISTLADMVAEADEASEAMRADQALLDRVLGMSFVDAPESALSELEPLRRDARSAQVPLDLSLRSTLTTFIRVTSSDIWGRDYTDLGLLAEAYGPRFSVVAARLVAAPDSTDPSSIIPDTVADAVEPAIQVANQGNGDGARGIDLVEETPADSAPTVGVSTNEPTTDDLPLDDGVLSDAEDTDVPVSDDGAETDPAQVSHGADAQAVAHDGAAPAIADAEAAPATTTASGAEPEAVVEVSARAGDADSQVSAEQQPDEAASETLEGDLAAGASDGTEPAEDPWSNGQITTLISAGRERLAVVVAEALGLPDRQVRTLRLLAGAFGSRADTLLAQEPDLLADDNADADRSADDSRLLFAAYSRLALELGFSPVGSLERFRQAAALDAHPASEVASEIVRLVTRGFKRPLGAVELTALPDDWRRYADAVNAKIEVLKSMRTSYQRASKIIHYLARTNQPVGGALEKCAELARRSAAGERPKHDEWAEVTSLIATLRDPHQFERLLSDADHALSSSQQLRSPIIASARDKLCSALDEVAEILEEGLALRARAEGADASDDPQGMADLVALARAASSPSVRTVGDAALNRLIDWVCADDVTVQSAAPLTQLLADELLPLYEVARDVNGVPARSTLGREEVQSLIDGRDPLAVVRGYLEVGNVRMAEHVLRINPQVRTSVIDDELAQAQQSLARTHRELAAEVDRVLDRLRSLYDDDLVRQLSQELEEHRELTPGRFDLHLGPLASVSDRGEARLDEVRSGLRDRAAKVPHQHEAQRILSLLDSKDEQLAVDYLTLAEAGEPLPLLSRPAGDDFGDFFPGVVRVAESATAQRAVDNLQTVRKHLGATGNPKNRMLREGLKSWGELVVDRGARQTTELRLANVLRMLGLIPADERWLKELTKAKNSGYATYAVKASPIDRSYVPSLGTQAHGAYDVTLVWDEASPQRLLQYVETNRRTHANIILYLRTLPVEQRLELRKVTARAGFDFSPIVVDMPVITWLSAREEPGWRLTQRVTLPFTTLNPYTPFAGGEVPDEVFVGREAERREIVDPTGSMFVYGGRQLGKSALLRRVERGIMSHAGSDEVSFDHGQVAVYLDLKSEGIGESAPPSALWAALSRRLTKVGVLTPSDSESTADSVATGIVNWLDADASRRLLLLLDEADNFLTLDAMGSDSAPVGGFPVLQRLKGIMESTGRRFKPVFAGLHQVQRFHGLPNTPVVHGGRDILIGPLRPVDARELVRDPLFVLGYEFETQDTMWRLLRLTNYQASLIQIICEALVRHMRSKELPREGGRAIIRTRDVDDIYAKREVRDLIAQRFRWTINLDSRYKVIALVTALRSLDSKPGERFRSSELHEDCAYFWQEGFSRTVLSSSEFRRYLSEMQGLGVLHRQGDGFGLRSPSILGLLGSRDTIEAELLEASDQLDVAYQYNPTMNRRVLSQDPAGAETRSPLPDSELAALLDDRSEARVTVVTGTDALGLGRVATALQRAAEERQIRLADVDATALMDQITGDGGAHLVLDLTSADAAGRRAALSTLEKFRTTRATVVLPADGVTRDLAGFNWPLVSLQRWSVEGLQAWHESPFRRSDLRDVTGGWPELVERAISLVMRGASQEAALSTVASELSDPKIASQFLVRAGVARETAQTWLEWFGGDSASGTASLLPATIDDLNTAFDTDARPILEHLQLIDAVDETPDGWVLDGIVALATRHSQG